MSTISLLWHDYETWGVDPRRDRAAQFAAIRTNEALEEIGEPVNIYCKPCDDYLPHPEAALITGITPQQTQKYGLCEADFFTQINDLFMQPGTCGVGYNSIRFDDEITRNGFFRNFIDPYAREWQNGNSRWDIIDLVRMTFALRPEGVNWPVGENGLTSFRLELLTQANGISHIGAHDALSDVRATIAMAKLIKETKPKLYDYYFRLRNKGVAAQLLDLEQKKTVLHVSGMYSVEQGCLSPIVPLIQHPVNSNEIIVYDLRKPPQDLLAMSSEEITENLYTKTSDLAPDVQRVGLKGVHLNKSPALAPVNTLSEAKAGEWGIDWQQVEQHRQQLLADRTLSERLTEVYLSHKKEFTENDADHALYNGFVSLADRALCNQVLKKRPQERVAWIPTFADKRLQTIYPRYLGRNWPQLLNEQQLRQWQVFCEARLIDGEFECPLTLQEYLDVIESLLDQSLTEDKKAILKALIEWVNR